MAERIRVRNVYPFSDDDRRMLAAIDPRLEWIHEGQDDQEWADALVDPDVQILSASVAPRTLEHAPRLRWLLTSGAGVDSLVPLDPWSRGITVTNGSGLHAVHMAEYLVGGVLFASERIEARLANHETRDWDSVRIALAGRRLRGRTAVVVGYGSIGRETARLLSAFGVRIIAVKNDPTRLANEGWREPGTGDPDGTLPERVVGPGSLVEVVRDAEYVLLTLPATAASAGIVSAAVLAAMRPDAWLLNVGRGALVDQEALIDALRGRRLGGAVLDVTTPEPLPADHPLWSTPNCLVTPHVSGTGDLVELWHLSAVLLAEQLRRELDGLPLLNRTSGTAGY